MLDSLIIQLRDGNSLNTGQIEASIECLIDENVPAETKAGFLTALAVKGETVEELSAFASILRSKAVVPPIDDETRSRGILDVCGTGGDHLNTFNISTTVSILAASAGIPVAKHGNRAITSKSGSADVLKALGIPCELKPEEAAASLRQHDFAFFFAPHYHPAFKHIAPARKLCAERKQRTLFNFLGPLLNPAKPYAQLIGAPNPALCEPLAKILQNLGIQRGLVACGRSDEHFMDELSTLGKTTICEFLHDRGFNESEIDPGAFPLQPASIEDLKGGDAEANARIIEEILNGKERGPKRDIALMNAAAALFVSDRCPTITEGWDIAVKLIDEGKAGQKLEELRSGSR